MSNAQAHTSGDGGRLSPHSDTHFLGDSQPYPTRTSSIERQSRGGTPISGFTPAESTTRPYSHLPTPQSPKNPGHYIPNGPYSPESPVPHALNQPPVDLMDSVQRAGSHRSDELGVRRLPAQHQTITPESSPYTRITPGSSRLNSYPHRSGFSTPTPSTSSIKLEPFSGFESSPRAPEPPEQPRLLSSPFMAKLSMGDRKSKPNTPVASPPPTSAIVRSRRVDDVFVSAAPSSSQTPSSTVPLAALSPRPIRPHPSNVGSELDRMKQAMLQERFSQAQEAERRRPEYLIRAKRDISEVDPSADATDNNRYQESGHGVGIMESPHKGRRLKLFQETSEESFEESLMAGGYGLYRTADWVRRDHHPLAHQAPALTESSTALPKDIDDPPPPPTERDLKKLRRLAAFRPDPSLKRTTSARLQAVEMQGKGRVLVDLSVEERPPPAPPELSPAKKKTSARRRKKEPVKAITAPVMVMNPESGSERPNWPDAEFPWRLRTQERAEIVKMDEEERLRWIERFLDRDSDDEEDDTDVDYLGSAPPLETQWRPASNEPHPVRRGRGKMIGLSDESQDKPRKTYFPSDPADALAALMSKRSVRTLSRRQQRRKQGSGDAGEDDDVCFCHGGDDGRELVQCDGCETWYHLECIGINDISELGREEDPWFCSNCERKGKAPPSPPLISVSHEPTFAPTAEEINYRRSADAPFYQANAAQDSPLGWSHAPPKPPRTPTRIGRTPSHHDPTYPSPSSWVNSSNHGPSTPLHRADGARVYTHQSPGLVDETPFDPTSTPSRGLKFGTQFSTPKWSSRATGLFHTPLRSSGRDMPRFPHLSNPDDGGGQDRGPLPRVPVYEESPIRRTKSGETARPQRRSIESPVNSLSRSSTILNASYLAEESPVMRANGKERFGRVPYDD